MASYTDLDRLVDDFAHDFKRHIHLKEERIKHLESKVAKLRTLIDPRFAVLEKQQNEKSRTSEGQGSAKAAEDAIRNLLEARDPKNFINTDLGSGNISSSAYNSLARAYRTTYRELVTLAGAFCTIRSRFENNQKKGALWAQNFKQDSFRVNVDGEEVTFQRTVPSKSSGEGDETRDEEGREEDVAEPAIPLPSNLTQLGNDSVQDQDLLSTQSTAEPADVPQLQHSSSGDLEFMSSRPAKGGRIEQHRARTEEPQSSLRTGSFARPFTVKSEPSSDSPRDGEPGSPVILESPETQDLDAGNSNLPVCTIGAERDITTYAEMQPPQTEIRPLAAGVKRRRALQEISSNAQITSRDSVTSNSKRRRHRGAAAIPSVAEDGEDTSIYRQRSGMREPERAPARDSVACRVQNLLDTPPAQRPILKVTPRTVIRAPPALTPASAVRNTNRRSSINHRNEEPLRRRPLNQLGLEHFKINPEKNQGFDYAFGEVVQNRSTKKCLPGCLAAACCGPTFRAMARSDIPKQVTLATLTPEHRRLLEQFQGDYPSNLDALSDQQLYELLIEAKAWDHSNRFSKHRHQHGRPPSPPGFWRTDMPSTQEAAVDREKARELELDKVRERYQEALRGGRWKFADE